MYVNSHISLAPSPRDHVIYIPHFVVLHPAAGTTNSRGLVGNHWEVHHNIGESSALSEFIPVDISRVLMQLLQ